MMRWLFSVILALFSAHGGNGDCKVAIDLVYLIDKTESMKQHRKRVYDYTSAITNDVIQAYPESRFGIMSFRNKPSLGGAPSDYCVARHTALTANTHSISGYFDTDLYHGGGTPGIEDGLTALVGTLQDIGLEWRSNNATTLPLIRLVLLITDAPAWLDLNNDISAFSRLQPFSGIYKFWECNTTRPPTINHVQDALRSRNANLATLLLDSDPSKGGFSNEPSKYQRNDIDQVRRYWNDLNEVLDQSSIFVRDFENDDMHTFIHNIINEAITHQLNGSCQPQPPPHTLTSTIPPQSPSTPTIIHPTSSDSFSPPTQPVPTNSTDLDSTDHALEPLPIDYILLIDWESAYLHAPYVNLYRQIVSGLRDLVHNHNQLHSQHHRTALFLVKDKAQEYPFCVAQAVALNQPTNDIVDWIDHNWDFVWNLPLHDHARQTNSYDMDGSTDGFTAMWVASRHLYGPLTQDQNLTHHHHHHHHHHDDDIQPRKKVFLHISRKPLKIGHEGHGYQSTNLEWYIDLPPFREYWDDSLDPHAAKYYPHGACRRQSPPTITQMRSELQRVHGIMAAVAIDDPDSELRPLPSDQKNLKHPWDHRPATHLNVPKKNQPRGANTLFWESIATQIPAPEDAVFKVDGITLDPQKFATWLTHLTEDNLIDTKLEQIQVSTILQPSNTTDIIPENHADIAKIEIKAILSQSLNQTAVGGNATSGPSEDSAGGSVAKTSARDRLREIVSANNKSLMS